MTARLARHLRYSAAIGIPVVLVLSALYGQRQPSVFSALLLFLAMLPFFLHFERSRPQARQIVPLALLAAVATAGRVAFAFAPQFKPTTAIVLIAGFSFGPAAGFLTGAVTALASNFFFGQGAWTPWQMAGWGMVGLLGGLLRNSSLLKRRYLLAIFGALCAFLFGMVMNIWHIIGFIRPLTVSTALAAYAAGFFFDLAHAVSTALFLVLLGPVWVARIRRIYVKYGLAGPIDTESGRTVK